MKAHVQFTRLALPRSSQETCDWEIEILFDILLDSFFVIDNKQHFSQDQHFLSLF